MAHKKKKAYQTLLFWEIMFGILVMLGIVIFLMIELGKNPVGPQETKPTYQLVETTEEPTEDTIPLPEPNPIDLGDFAMKGDYLHCLTTESWLGIDVSFWQGNINWQKVKEAGVEFAMIRAAWRGSEVPTIHEDDFVHRNYTGARSAGIKVGAYFFSQAITVEEAVEEAEYLLDIIDGWEVEMPIVFDWEVIDAGARTRGMDARTLTDITKAFCETIKNAGYEPMIYFSMDQSLHGIYLRELTDYKFWLAQYNTVLNYPYKIDMWQYTETGSVPGISGNVDINLYFPWEE